MQKPMDRALGLRRGFVARTCRTSLCVLKGIDDRRFQPGALSCLSNIIPRDAVILPSKGMRQLRSWATEHTIEPMFSTPFASEILTSDSSFLRAREPCWD